MQITSSLSSVFRWPCVLVAVALTASAPGQSVTDGFDAPAAGTNCAALNNVAVFRSGNPAFVYDEYASAVALSDDTVVVGARADFKPYGALHIYARSNGVWVFQQRLTPRVDLGAQFLGDPVAIDGDTIVAGMPESAQVFVREGGRWRFQQVLLPDDAGPQQYFGYSVAIRGEQIIVGAPADNNVTGAAYVFERRAGNWEQMAKLTASDPHTWDGFGWSVSLSGATAVVGTGRYNGVAGVGYVFTRADGVWSEQAILSVAGNRLFNGGITVSVSGDAAAINYLGFPKAVSVFRRNGSTWRLEQTLKARSQIMEPGFGFAPVLRGDRLVVGSPGASLSVPSTGVVRVFHYTGSQWVEEQLIAPAPGTAASLPSFGRVLAVNHTGVLAGAHGSFSGPDRSGAAFLFESDSTPPSIHSVTVTPPVLWPPNHRMVPVKITATASDNCGQTRCRITSITSNEKPDKPATIDWQITGDLTANLRATREGKGPGRIYAITVECQDDVGNTSEAVVTVTVPHDNHPPKH